MPSETMKKTIHVICAALFVGLFMISTVGMAANHGQSCQAVISESTLYPFQELRTGRTETYLGRGFFGRVFLRFESSGDYSVYKIYGSIADPKGLQIFSDIRSFDFLAKHTDRFSFKLPQYEQVDNTTLKLSYHPGLTLQSLMKEPHVHYEIRKKVRLQYQAMIQELKLLLASHDFEIKITTPEGFERLWASRIENGIKTSFIIKVDNVIVDPNDLSFTLIDPY